jgi:glycosyltransferase involved in cell wall biosynthesis
MLNSIAECDRPNTAEWQVLVVDNADCADTRRVAEGFRDRLPIDVLIEPEAGLSRARNAAVRHLNCDYFVWTDDDVTVPPHWLTRYETAFDANPDAAFFGGPIVPRFEGRPPAWLMGALPLINSAFAGLDLANNTREGRLEAGHLPFGANMAIRASEQRRRLYDVTLGRQPGQWLVSGEESTLLKLICRDGGFGVWLADAGVTHWIDADRQSIAYLRRYYEGRAVVKARKVLGNKSGLARQSGHESSTTMLRRDLLWSELRYLHGRLLRQPGLWVTALKEASRLRGTLAARRQFQRQGGLGLKAEEG